MGIIESIYSFRSLQGRTGRNVESANRRLTEAGTPRIAGTVAASGAGGESVAPRGVVAKGNSSPEAGEEKARTGREQASEKEYASLEDSLSAHGLRLKFNVDEKTDIMQVEVIDSESGKTVRKLPPDELLHLSASIKELSRGLLDRSY